MKFPNFREEKKLWEKGYKHVVGLDEVGRGSLAGPVVAAAVIIKLSNKKHSDILQNVRMFFGLRDSKKLSEKQRELFYEILTSHKNIQWGIGMVSEKVIDKINILEATKLAMVKAITSLNSKSQITNYKKYQNSKFQIKNMDFLLIDGNFKIKSNISQKSVIKGDEKIFSCAAASIIAKVTRDRIMKKMHKKYVEYGFDSHKGYGTAQHIENLKKFGPCKIHRKSFEPIKSLVKTEII